jgi:transcriptional regulator of acetoin/glycerol metabolism
MVATLEETFEEERPTCSQPCSVIPHLFVVLDCDQPSAGGARHSLRAIDEVLIVHGPDRKATREVVCGVRRLSLQLPGRFVSHPRARLVRRANQWGIEGDGSAQGIFLNGARVEEASLGDGDSFDVGHTIFRLRLGLRTPIETPLDSQSSRGNVALPPTLLPYFARELGELSKVSVSKLPIVLVGETGTGKEVFARAIHVTSRRSGPFVAVNCGALPANLVESQLFGHVRGAFSGAIRDEIGFVRAADGGTLLLDELGDLPKAAQAALLRVLQEGEVVPVGSTRAVRVDVRVVVATQEPLDELVTQGKFRCDLRARLEGFVTPLPNVRDRREDMGLLLSALCKKLGPSPDARVELRPDAGRALCAYDWPLNVRELEQCLARALALSGGEPIERHHLPPHIASAHGKSPSSPPSWRDEAALRRELVAKLEEHSGNVTHVARAMGRARMQVHRWMGRLAIDPAEFRRVR